jgi:hypothetical protein
MRGDGRYKKNNRIEISQAHHSMACMMNLSRPAAIISLKAADNPHRSVGYFVGIMTSQP